MTLIVFFFVSILIRPDGIFEKNIGVNMVMSEIKNAASFSRVVHILNLIQILNESRN